MLKLIQPLLDSNPDMQDQLSVKRFIPGIAWFVLVLVLICLPGSDIPTVETWLNDIYFDKWVHTGLFAVLAFLFIYPVCRSGLPTAAKRKIAIKIALAASVWALATEFIQRYFIPDRDLDILDWACDTLGIIIAWTWCRKKYLQ